MKKILLIIIVIFFILSPYKALGTELDNNLEEDEEFKKIYLTFDDGPSQYNTYKILELLDKYDAKATFFLVGSKVAKFKEQSKAIQDAGHVIGSHSYSHSPNIVYKDIDSFTEDFRLWKETFNEQFGFVPKFFRFPYGSKNSMVNIDGDDDNLMVKAARLIKSEGIEFYDWNVSSGDGSSLVPSQYIFNNATKGMDEKEVPIILLHDPNNNTLKVLEYILIYGANHGYIFRGLDESVPAPQFIGYIKQVED